MTPAERQAKYRERLRGGPPRTPADDPLSRAQRRRRAGTPVADLADDERQALRAYNAAAAARARARRRE